MKRADSTYAIAADMNPGLFPVDNSGDNPTTIATNASRAMMQYGNSRNHGSQGQNVLYDDAHAGWQDNPFCGTGRDNIYTGRYTDTSTAHTSPFVTGGSITPGAAATGPYNRTDSILLPAYSNGGHY